MPTWKRPPLVGANTNCLKIIVRKPLLLLLVPLNVLHLVLLLLQPLALAQEHEEPLLDTDRDFTMSIS
jgi:hypothetical protein